MPKIKNKFIIFIILVIISIIGFGIFNSYFNKNINRDSNVVLINGKATLNSKLLKVNDKQLLSIGDTVRTIGDNALAILEWGDGSVTRLGGNTSIKIEELYLSDDLNKMNIAFELLNGKSWSNVISFLGEDSYFKEHFRDSEAAVRGTIFNVDLTNDYLYVIDHKVNLTTNEGEIIVVDEKNPFDLSTFSFIALEEFLNSIKDKAWENLNSIRDKDYLDGLKKQIHSNLDELIDLKEIDIEKALLNNEDREELYNRLLTEYQKFNFVKPEDNDLFKTKLELKESLIKLADDENKSVLVENTLYDFDNILDSKQYENLDSVLTIFSDNKELLGDFNIENYFKTNIIPEDLKNTMFDNFNDLKGVFGEVFGSPNDLNLNNVQESVNGLIHEGLDTLFNK